MSIAKDIQARFPAENTRNVAQSAPLVLAYMGDTVYDLYVRTMLLSQGDSTAHGFHMRASRLVCAAAQAAAARRLLPLFTTEETAVFKRGRNAHMGTIARNASIADYRAATGLEAVLGYLYLLGQDERIGELMQTALDNPQ